MLDASGGAPIFCGSAFALQQIIRKASRYAALARLIMFPPIRREPISAGFLQLIIARYLAIALRCGGRTRHLSLGEERCRHINSAK
jgi:hypothetical protein